MIKEDDIDVMNNKKEEIQEDKIHGNLVNVLLGKTLEEALEDIKNAITLEEASTFFNSKMIIELDSEENNLFVNDIVNKIEAIENITEKKVIATEKKKEDEAKIEDNIDIVESLITNGVAVNVARALVKKLGSEALEKASEVNFEMTSLIKMI